MTTEHPIALRGADEMRDRGSGNRYLGACLDREGGCKQAPDTEAGHRSDSPSDYRDSA
jgi:hypothetical protein